VCEDNYWAISVPKEKSTAIADNSDRGAAYGIPGVLIADNDVVAIYEAAGESVDRARSGGGPSLIEIKTDRLFGHFEGDPQLYRAEDEIPSLQERDAIKRFERQLQDNGVMSADDVEAAWAGGRAEVDEAIEFARSSPYPEPASALDHVFA
jgi:TPP-dependent pyruvate/acetoin dehydrogenase alpha subunit